MIQSNVVEASRQGSVREADGCWLFLHLRACSSAHPRIFGLLTGRSNRPTNGYAVAKIADI